MKNMDLFRYIRLFTPPLAVLFVLGCTPGSVQPLPASNLDPYLTATPAVSPSATVQVTDIPVPTSTPSTYTIASGDNLSSIAERFGISLDALLAANPGVVPEALSLGQTLKIPAASPGTGSSAASTPAPVEIGPVQCASGGSASGLYCLAPVRNPFAEALENIKLQIILLDANGQSLASQEAFLPLNILPPGSTLPAYAYFPILIAPVQSFHPIAQLVTSIRLRSDDARYLPAVVRNVLTSVGWNGRSAQVQGQIFLPAEGRPAGTVWLGAVAYNADDRVVGFRRWEWQGSLQPGTFQSFDFFVYSLGPMIERVDMLVEARP